ncbi:TPA: holin [Streptococcus suis]|nr:phage holin [Streptococcus suis]HEM2885302.1 holin [Streptococcus suis]HEM4364806.1 holin [Streptococcus suis]HEM4548564.1 holin [Streptococcus suis]HEM4585800.1 holin [Streptococcus suis]
MKLTNKQYDVAKTTVTIVAPAAITLISALGALYGFDATVINGTIAAVATFSGTVLGVSSKNYHQENN